MGRLHVQGGSTPQAACIACGWGAGGTLARLACPHLAPRPQAAASWVPPRMAVPVTRGLRPCSSPGLWWGTFASRRAGCSPGCPSTTRAVAVTHSVSLLVLVRDGGTVMMTERTREGPVCPRPGCLCEWWALTQRAFPFERPLFRTCVPVSDLSAGPALHRKLPGRRTSQHDPVEPRGPPLLSVWELCSPPSAVRVGAPLRRLSPGFLQLPQSWARCVPGRSPAHSLPAQQPRRPFHTIGQAVSALRWGRARPAAHPKPACRGSSSTAAPPSLPVPPAAAPLAARCSGPAPGRALAVPSAWKGEALPSGTRCLTPPSFPWGCAAVTFPVHASLTACPRRLPGLRRRLSSAGSLCPAGAASATRPEPCLARSEPASR